MMRTLLSGLLLALHTTLAFGQAKPAPSETWQSVFFDSPETALPLLTAAALRHSAQMKAMELEKGIAKQNVTLAKEAIFNNVAVGANYSYGNLLAVGNLGVDQIAIRNTPRYSAVASLNLPLGQFVSRGNNIKREQLALQRTEALQQDRENQIREQIIPMYQSVRLARKVFTLQQEALVNVRTNYQLAEKQFRQGQMTLQELSGANSSLTSASVALESARNQYDTAFMLLEEVVGAKISTLMTSK
ncbi:TolC family protein [Hymenobacter arizonensis]|uniref:Outer membrane efflux protein n=1 Tax=Hymenobacter arizonensis TaxID=1227077 RepID=A0A1I5Z6J4_HYMAR|nr:TolC family protein [Hymenobacter arizonensis]SFQ52086.1 Outer membrane efflux protein [Hymenobacter arizonensis]